MSKRRGGFSWIEALVILVFLVILAAILLPVFMKPSPPRGTRCFSNLKQIGLAFIQYAQEYDERMPPVKFNATPSGVLGQENYRPYGWMDALQPYLKSTQLFQCPSEPQTAPVSDPMQSGYTDYWYNTNLSKLKLDKIIVPPSTLLSGDGNDGTYNTNARYTLNALPPSWIATEKSPARRHLDTGVYLFADGHVKSIMPQNISVLPLNQSSSTFSVK